MVTLKSDQELTAMQEGGEIVREVMQELIPTVVAGITTREIDSFAEEKMRQKGATPAFQRVKNYKWTTCLPINEQVVHTPPSERVLKNGDVLTVDIGAYYKGLNTDHAITLVVGGEEHQDEKIFNFLHKGEETLKKAIQLAKNCEYIGEISQLIEKEIYGAGYFIMRELTGHGIGPELHEDPYVPGYLDVPLKKTYKIRPGLAIAIEIIYSMGTEKIIYEKGSDWSIATKDGSMSACFEDTIGFFTDGARVLT